MDDPKKASAKELRADGRTADFLKQAGYTSEEIYEAGYSTAELLAADFTLLEIKAMKREMRRRALLTRVQKDEEEQFRGRVRQFILTSGVAAKANGKGCMGSVSRGSPKHQIVTTSSQQVAATEPVTVSTSSVANVSCSDRVDEQAQQGPDAPTLTFNSPLRKPTAMLLLSARRHARPLANVLLSARLQQPSFPTHQYSSTSATHTHGQSNGLTDHDCECESERSPGAGSTSARRSGQRPQLRIRPRAVLPLILSHRLLSSDFQPLQRSTHRPLALARREEGVSADQCRGEGYAAVELRLAGYTLEELWDAGYSMSQLQAAAFTPQQIKATRVQARRSAGAARLGIMTAKKRRGHRSLAPVRV